jgi:uncharacterized protein DUF4136
MKPFTVLFVVHLQLEFTHYDYDKRADFTDYMTYDWMPIPKEQDIWRLNFEIYKREVNNRLKGKGLMMTSKNPDFLIVQNLKIKRNTDRYIIIYNNSLPFRERNNTHSEVVSYEFDLGSIFIELIDAESNKRIWWAVAEAEVDTVEAADTPEKKEKLIKEAVHEILENFPPKHYEQ